MLAIVLALTWLRVFLAFSPASRNLNKGENMDFFTPEIRERLLANGGLRRDWPTHRAEPGFFPVVKLFTSDAGCTWLLTEIDPDDEDIAFGLCDLGILAEIASLRGRLRLPVERDVHFAATKTLAEYADETAHARGIRV